MAEAEKSHAEWHARQRLNRARNSRSKPCYNYGPGELVYFWRTQEAGKKGPKLGRFLGPARVLATEKRRESDGSLRPGSAVWVVRGRSLLKCCPEQLCRASTREELIENLSAQDKTPWSFTRTAEAIGGTNYEDISAEAPEQAEWHRAQDTEQEVPPSRHRMTRKRAAPASEDSTGMEVSGPPRGGPLVKAPAQPWWPRRPGGNGCLTPHGRQKRRVFGLMNRPQWHWNLKCPPRTGAGRVPFATCHATCREP